MEISETQYQHIAHCLPVQRGNVRLPNIQVLNAILYVAEHGCKWRGLPEHFGPWHTVYTRMMRWAKSGVLDQVFEAMQSKPFPSTARASRCTLMVPALKKKRSPSHRQIPRWLDHQNSSGCRE